MSDTFWQKISGPFHLSWNSGKKVWRGEVIMTNTKYPEYVFHGAIDNSFYEVWLQMSQVLIAESEKYGHRDSLEQWIKKVICNNHGRIISIQEIISSLDFKSIEISNVISRRYNDHFLLLLSKCTDYETVINLVAYWEELPARFEEVLEEIHDNMEMIDFTKVEVSESDFLIQKEGSFECDVEEVGITNFFFHLEGLS